MHELCMYNREAPSCTYGRMARPCTHYGITHIFYLRRTRKMASENRPLAVLIVVKQFNLREDIFGGNFHSMLNTHVRANANTGKHKHERSMCGLHGSLTTDKRAHHLILNASSHRAHDAAALFYVHRRMCVSESESTVDPTRPHMQARN